MLVYTFLVNNMLVLLREFFIPVLVYVSADDAEGYTSVWV